MLEFQRRAEVRGTLKLRAAETQPLVAEAKKNESRNSSPEKEGGVGLSAYSLLLSDAKEAVI